MRELILRQLVELLGDRPIGTIDKADMRELLPKIQALPSNFTKKFPGLDAAQVIAQTVNDPELPRLSVRSVNKYLMTVRALFNWAVDHDVIPKSPASVLRDLDEGDAQSARLPLSDDDLKVFFANLKADAKRDDAYYWIPLIMAFQGCRLEEPAQLCAEDVKAVQGVLCFDFNEDSPDKTLKTESSRRTVPVHPRLVELGLLDYVRHIGSGRLFPKLRKNKNGYGDRVSRWANKRLNRLGITDKRKALYSLRHTFNDKLRDAGVELYVLKALMGHADDDITTSLYGAKIKPARMLEVLNRLELPI